MKKMKARRIAAITGVVLLVLLYVITLIAAIFDFDGSGTLFGSLTLPFKHHNT